jgi:hypothetical protein
VATTVNRAAINRVTVELGRRAQAARRASGLSVTVGIHEEEGSSAEEGGATLADIAAFHEFGTSRVPRRSWLLDGLAENEGAIREAFRRLGRATAQGRFSAEQGYLQLGEFVVAKLQARIRANIPPPLAPATVARKGSSVALIDEGRLFAAIRAKIRRG